MRTPHMPREYASLEASRQVWSAAKWNEAYEGM